MAQRKPNHADAELVLKLYDLRREPLMRESRKTILNWMPSSFDDVRELLAFDHPDNAAWRQVSSYFEYAFGFAKHGIVPPDFLAEYNGEGILLYAKMEPFLDEFRAATAPTAFQNTEWVISRSAWAKARLELFRKRLAAYRDQQAKDDKTKSRKATAKRTARRKTAAKKAATRRSAKKRKTSVRRSGR